MGKATSGGRDDPFAPGDVTWVGVSPRLVTLRRALVSAAAVPALGVAALVVTAGGLHWWGGAVLAAGVGSWAAAWSVAARTARSWRYAERADDLLIAHGVLVRRLVAVPYGRIQLVDVSAGPVERRFGLARVHLHTAAATTDAHLPGVPPEQAGRLRDHLATLGAAKAAGL